MEHKENTTLPNFITGRTDISRLIRELIAIEDNLYALKLRQPGTSVSLTKSSILMEKLLQYYNLNLLKDEDRSQLKKFLYDIKDKAPNIHMSFSSDPSVAFLDRLVGWLRQNIHPNVLLNVGLQPTIGVGVIVRTNNKYFDFSLTEDMKKNKAVLLDQINKLQPVPEPNLPQVAVSE